MTLEYTFGNWLTVTGDGESTRIYRGFTYSVSTEDNQTLVTGVDGTSLCLVESAADGTRSSTELGLTFEITTPFSGAEPDNPVQEEMVITDEGMAGSP